MGVANPKYTPLPPSPAGYSSFDAFYPFYLGEHNNKICRRLHLVGTSVTWLVLGRVLASRLPRAELQLARPAWQYLAGGVLQAYFFAWVGHFFYEHNKPATFKYPGYSFLGDLRMHFEVLTLQRSP